jgi:lysozyme
VNELLLELIKRFEGCRLRAYLCPAGIPTVGWGSTGPDVKLGDAWTQEQADARMAADALMFQTATHAQCPTADTDGRLAALSDFAYNMGLTRLKGSTLRRRALAGDWDAVAVELNRWVYAAGKKLPGLVKRRSAEAALL